jgi:hypothetical protein
MNAQERMIDSRTFRIAAIAVAAVAMLVLAAYLFGTRLRADTSALGANSADVRAAALAAQAQRRADFYADVNNSAKATTRAAALAALEKSRADFHAEQNAAAEAARWASVAAADQDFAVFYHGVNATNTAVEAARLASLRAISTRRPSFLADPNTSGAPAAADPSQRMGFASPESVRAGSSAADPYQDEWMGFTAPESVGARLPSVAGAGASGSPWIKPEGVKTGGVLFAAAPGQYQWIKPEGISTAGAK